MPFYIHTYKSQSELNRTHPDVINWTCVLQKPRGMNDQTTIRINVLKALERRGIQAQPVYQVGDFFWIPANDARPACKCIHHIGDNGPCAIHGDPYAQFEGRA